MYEKRRRIVVGFHSIWELQEGLLDIGSGPSRFGGSGGMETSIRNALGPEDVFRAVAAVAVNAVSEDRQQGEAMLLSWENELAPGYIYGLLETVSRGVAINEVPALFSLQTCLELT